MIITSRSRQICLLFPAQKRCIGQTEGKNLLVTS